MMVNSGIGCYCTIEDRKSESNSQHDSCVPQEHESCYCTIEDRKSESNSQQFLGEEHRQKVVIALSKIENLKAIHNRVTIYFVCGFVVIALSKIENLKAIHNRYY